MNAYHNMSCPPRSRVQKCVTLVGAQVCFSFRYIGLEMPGFDSSMPDALRDSIIQAWINTYVIHHQAELDALECPKGYMIGNVYENEAAVEKAQNVYHFRCSEPILTIAVLSRMSGNIYIPQRLPHLTCHSHGYNNIVSFPAKDVAQYKI